MIYGFVSSMDGETTRVLFRSKKMMILLSSAKLLLKKYFNCFI